MGQVPSLRNDKNHNYVPLIPVVIWCFRLGACDQVPISVCKREPTAIILHVLGATWPKFSLLGDKAAQNLCSPVLILIINELQFQCLSRFCS